MFVLVCVCVVKGACRHGPSACPYLGAHDGLGVFASLKQLLQGRVALDRPDPYAERAPPPLPPTRQGPAHTYLGDNIDERSHHVGVPGQLAAERGLHRTLNRTRLLPARKPLNHF